MLKFKYNYQQNTLAYQQGEYWYEIAEEGQFQGNFGSQGFKLENGWISFTVYEKQIQAFYKQADLWGSTYFRKYLPRQDTITFTFTEKDQVEKTNGKWGKKYG